DEARRLVALAHARELVLLLRLLELLPVPVELLAERVGAVAPLVDLAALAVGLEVEHDRGARPRDGEERERAERDVDPARRARRLLDESARDREVEGRRSARGRRRGRRGHGRRGLLGDGRRGRGGADPEADDGPLLAEAEDVAVLQAGVVGALLVHVGAVRRA